MIDDAFEELLWAMDWVLALATPPRPDPSAWTDVAWVEYWREQRGRALRAMERAKWAERMR